MRSEQALTLTLANMYVCGVSTRRVNEALSVLGGGLNISSSDVSRATKLLDEELSKWRNRPLEKYPYVLLDTRYEKVREGGCALDSAVLIACGINSKGFREILGVSVSLSEH